MPRSPLLDAIDNVGPVDPLSRPPLDSRLTSGVGDIQLADEARRMFDAGRWDRERLAAIAQNQMATAPYREFQDWPGRPNV